MFDVTGAPYERDMCACVTAAGEAIEAPGARAARPAEDHADAGGPGSGTVDVRTVASWMANLAAMCRERDDAERIDLIRALEELKAGAAAAQARLTSDLDASRRAERARAGVPPERRGQGIAAEVALARRASPTRGGQHLGLATALVREMPHTHAALTSGALTEWRATILVRESACLGIEDRALFDAHLAADQDAISSWGDQRLANEAKRVAYRLDAAAVVRRARRAESERCVTIRPAPDTMTYLTGLLPVTQGVAVHAALSRAADTARAGGDARTRGQIMADTLISRITGREHADQIPLQVQLVMTDHALLTGSEEPARVPGHGAVPGQWARDQVRRALLTPAPARPPARTAGPAIAHSAGGVSSGQAPAPSAPGSGVWIRRLYRRPGTGELVAMDSRARRAPAGLARFIAARDQACRTPWCDAPIRHIDHVLPYGEGGPTSAPNLQGLCEACNHTKQAPGWSARPVPGTREVRTTTPSGRTYASLPPPSVGAA